jgi:ankyrin repeat protein
MMKAAAKGHAQVVELLLAHGAEVNAVDKGGYSALMVAAADGHAASVHLLLDHGADPDLQDGSLGWTALIWAAKEGQLETVELLLAGGASPQIVDNAGQSARRWAERLGHRAVAARLHAAGG